jgi:DNA-binding NtrC family response regulator
MSQNILVVSSDAVGLSAVLKVLTREGYRARGASTFEEAKRWLALRSPDLVIADERLGAFNGLHVILRGRADYPDMGAILTSHVKDPGLEAEARRFNVQCLVKPQDPVELLLPISRILEAQVEAGGDWFYGGEVDGDYRSDARAATGLPQTML